MARFRLEILTPTRRLFAEDADAIVFEAFDGGMTILPGHQAMVVPVRPGAVRVESPTGKQYGAIASGFVAVTPRKAEFFVDSAEWAGEIDLERAKAALDRAEKRLAEGGGAWESGRARDAAARARARIEAKEEHAKVLAARTQQSG